MSKTIEIQQFPLWDKLKDKRVPLSFDLEITARCNNDCRHCYINLPANDAHARAQELTVAEISHIADQAVKLGAMWCLITGGEPLLRSDFAEIYRALKRQGLLVSVFTNATTIRDEHLALWKKYPPRDIEVTVYGVTRGTYERVTRKPGSFDAFKRGLDALFDSGVHVRLKAMALQSNLDEFDAIAEFCRARTKDFYRFDPQLHGRFDGD
ncbi:MAG: radical SAM protein, partial [Anaerolineales bacterium]|nr:radical SAM protein [Anaerolineales bacterium]